LTTNFAELKKTIETISNPEDKKISQAMSILISALEVGPDADRIARHTGYPLALVEPIANRMREARLWSTTLVDDREWWGPEGDLIGPGLFAHALVGLGQMKRRTTSFGAEYVDTETDKVAREWHDEDKH
jgi:hypothetical protein